MRAMRVLKCIFVPLGLIVLAVIGLVTAMSDPPEASPPPDIIARSESWTGKDTDALVQLALSDFDANERLSDNVYQQIVVAGWASKDLLTVIGTAQSDQTEGLTAINENLRTMIENQAVLAEALTTPPPIDDRPRILLLLGVLALCWLGAWSVVPSTPPQVTGVRSSTAEPTTSSDDPSSSPDSGRLEEDTDRVLDEA